MIERIRNEPVMVVMALLAIANVAFGINPDIVADVLETAALLVGGAIARNRVTPSQEKQG